MVIAYVEVPVNNSMTCSYVVECCTEQEITDAKNKAYDEGRWPHVTRLVPKKPVDLIPANGADVDQTPFGNILFDVDDEDIII